MSKQGMCSTVWITIIPIMWNSFLQVWSHRFHTGLVISFHKIISIILTDNDENHAEELGARSQQGAKNHGILRWAEHITMDILPTRFLHCIFLLVTKREKKHWTSCKRYGKRQATNQNAASYHVIFSIVVGNVLPQRPYDDHTQDACRHNLLRSHDTNATENN